MRAPAAHWLGWLALAGCGSATIGDPPSGDDPDAMVQQVVDAPGPDAPAGPIDASPCTGGDARVRDPDTGVCYLYVNTPATWEDAAAACAQLGGTLAVPTSAGEDARIAALPTMPATLPDVWIGGSDALVEGEWRWITGEMMVYTNWRLGEPNDGAGEFPEDCMLIEADNGGTWDDRPCGAAYPYLCEHP